MTESSEPHDQRHLDAAEGWLGLGDHLEACEELEQIAASNRARPAVQEVRWQIYAMAKKWEAALEIASALVQPAPEHPLGWVNRSYCLHGLKRTAEARDNLLREVDKFPISATIRYNLACYEYQWGRLEQAKQWLEKACKLGEPTKIRLVALDDPDPEPVCKEIGRIYPRLAHESARWPCGPPIARDSLGRQRARHATRVP